MVSNVQVESSIKGFSLNADGDLIFLIKKKTHTYEYVIFRSVIIKNNAGPRVITLYLWVFFFISIFFLLPTIRNPFVYVVPFSRSSY